MDTLRLKLALQLTLGLICFATAQVAWAQTQRSSMTLASFNLAWAASERDYDQTLKACDVTKWCDPRPPRVPTISSLVQSEACQGITNAAWGGEFSANKAAPCNAYGFAKSKGIEVLKRKNALLGKTIEQLIRKPDQHDPVQIFAFQEVASSEAIQEIVGTDIAKEHFFCAAEKSETFQKVAFMWHRSLGEGDCSEFVELGVTDGTRKVRTGLRLSLMINGKSISFLNVHLKASCASVLPAGVGFPFPGRLLTDSDIACKTLAAQMNPLITWLQQTLQKSPHFVLLGDFNRRIDHESQLIEKGFIRSGGLLGDKEDNKKAPKFMWTHMADKLDVLKGISQIPLTELNNSSQQCSGFEGLDHIVLSPALTQIQNQSTRSIKTPVLGGVLGDPGNDDDKASDHCPRISKIVLPV